MTERARRRYQRTPTPPFAAPIGLFADGSGPIRLTENPWQDLFPVFSADGGRIPSTSNREGWAPEPRGNQIYSLAGDGPWQDVAEEPELDTWRQSLSPDTSRIAVSATRHPFGADMRLYVLGVDGSGLKAFVT